MYRDMPYSQTIHQVQTLYMSYMTYISTISNDTVAAYVGSPSEQNPEKKSCFQGRPYHEQEIMIQLAGIYCSIFLGMTWITTWIEEVWRKLNFQNLILRMSGCHLKQRGRSQFFRMQTDCDQIRGRPQFLSCLRNSQNVGNFEGREKVSRRVFVWFRLA